MKLKNLQFTLILSLISIVGYAQQDSLTIRKIYDQSLINGESYQNLKYLCKNIGPRISGSPKAQLSVEWGKKLMESYGFDKVFLQECMVPHWVRGEKEIGKIINGAKEINVAICALGNSPATPTNGLKARVIEVKSLKELETLGQEKIKGKNVVCIVSGSNNDIERTAEIKERSLLYEGLMHYFMIQFPQRPGALKEFVNNILGPDDDITYFQFAKKNSREKGSVVVGLELKNKNDIMPIKLKMTQNGFEFQYLNDNQDLFTQLIG